MAKQPPAGSLDKVRLEARGLPAELSRTTSWSILDENEGSS